MITFEPIPQEFLNRGYADYSDRTYHVKGYLPENLGLVKDLILNADILLHGAAPDFWLHERMKLNKVTIRYEERFFKRIDRRFIKRSFWESLYIAHTQYRNKPLYMLGASSFNKLDTSIIFAYPHKVFKWGYFTSVHDLDINKILLYKMVSTSQTISILWCGTIAQVKRPDLVPKLAKRLISDGYNFQIDIIGTGGLEHELKAQIKAYGVEKRINLLGNMPNDQVLTEMQRHHIFIFTSNYGEGWGAVLNEAMSNGCAVVCSDKVGASHFLIKDGYIEDSNLMKTCATNAYETMSTTWSPQNAASNFISFCDSLLTNTPIRIHEGPCSPAKLIW
jgi:glycosyltransferase involved in cell wall biosynthesis